MRHVLIVGLVAGALFAASLPVLAGDPPPLHPSLSDAADPSASPGTIVPDPSVVVIERTPGPSPTGGLLPPVTWPAMPPTDTGE